MVSALPTGRLYHPGNITGTLFCYSLYQPHVHSAAGRIMSMKNSSGPHGARHVFPINSLVCLSACLLNLQFPYQAVLCNFQLLTGLLRYLVDSRDFGVSQAGWELHSVLKMDFRSLTFYSPAVSLRTTRFNIQKFYMVLALCSCVLYGSQNRQRLCFIHHWLVGFYNRVGKFTARYGMIPYIKQIYNRGGKCLLRGTDWFLT
jgi:hypothetical protein